MTMTLTFLSSQSWTEDSCLTPSFPTNRRRSSGKVVIAHDKKEWSFLTLSSSKQLTVQCISHQWTRVNLTFSEI